jgi:hypothetical protein
LADAVSLLALPPMFLHFTQVFPDRRQRWAGAARARWFYCICPRPQGRAGNTVCERRDPQLCA